MATLDKLLSAHDWTEETAATQSSPVLVRSLLTHRESLLDRVDEIAQTATDADRDLLASESREIERAHNEVERTDQVISRAKPFADEAERIRHEHLVSSAGLISMTRSGSRPPSDPLGLVISRSLANEVRDAVRAGQSITRSLSDPFLDVWQTPSSPVVRGRLAAYATLVQGTSPQAAFVAVRPLVDAAVVAEGAAKPEIADATTVLAAHQKIAGYLDVSLEQIVYGVDVSAAIQTVAIRQLIEGENNAVAAALATATPVAAGASPAASVLSGIASVAAGGGIPSVVALNPADIPLVLGESSGAGYSVNQGGGAETLASTLWGVPVVPSGGVTAGSALVWDQAALGASVAMPPRILVDPYTKAVNNVTVVVVDEMIAFALLAPAQAAVVDLAGP